MKDYIIDVNTNGNKDKITEDVKKQLMKIKVNRDILKLPVMTISYY